MPPLTALAGRTGIRTLVTCNLGRVIDWQYTRNATGRDLSVTLAGTVKPPKGTALQVTVTQGNATVTFGPLPTDGEYSVTRLPGGAFTTELRASDTLYRTLANTELPELIPWVNNPNQEIKTSNTRTVFRGKKSIGAVLAEAIPGLGVSGNVLHEQAWEETRRTYSTAGKSGVDVFSDTYGLLNYELVLERNGSWRGYAPNEKRVTHTPQAWTAWSESEQHERLQAPSRVTIKGGDLWTRSETYLQDVATSGEAPSGAPDENGLPIPVGSSDPEAAQFEVLDGWEVTHVIESTTNGVRDGSISAIRKLKGRVVEEVNYTLGEAARYSTHTNQFGEQELRKWVTYPALLASTRTTFTYLTANGKTPRTTVTTSSAYAFRPFITYTGTLALPAHLAAKLTTGAPLLGDPVGTEVTRVDHVWSDYGGFLRERKTSEVKLVGLTQLDADITDEANPNAPVRAGESRFVTLETWVPSGDGWWLYTRRKYGPKEIYTYDSGGYIVKTLTVTALLDTHTEQTRDAPPLTDEPELPSPEEQRATIKADETGESDPAAPDPFPPFTYFQDPQEVTLTLGGDGTPAELSLPFVELRADLSPLGVIWAKELQPKTTRTVTLIEALDVDIRDELSGFGLVRGLSASGVGAAFRFSLTTEARDA